MPQLNAGLFAAVLSMVCLYGNAAPGAVIQVTIYGTAYSAINNAGFFGSDSNALIGQQTVSVSSFDSTRGRRFTTADSDFILGGQASQTQTPSLGGSFTLNGRTLTAGGTGGGSLLRYDNRPENIPFHSQNVVYQSGLALSLYDAVDFSDSRSIGAGINSFVAGPGSFAISFTSSAHYALPPGYFGYDSFNQNTAGGTFDTLTLIQSHVTSFDIDVFDVPEPTSWSIGVTCLLLAAGTVALRRRRRPRLQ